MSLNVGLAYNLKTHCPWARGEVEDEAADYDDPQTIREIAEALESGGHRTIHLPYDAGLLDALERFRPNVVFNLAEGWGDRNRESIVPAILEFLAIPYTGSDPLTLGAALDKHLAKKLVSEAGIPTARSFKVALSDSLPPGLCGLEFPMFVKPNAEGSSKGIRYSSKVRNTEELEAMVRWVHETYRTPALVEEYLPGREYSIGLLGNAHRLRTLPIVAVRPGKDVPRVALGDDPASEFIYSYEPKSTNMEAPECPAVMPRNLAQRIEELALAVWDVFECRDVARVDFKLGRDGEPYFLEINPLPSLSREWSFLALEARAAGIDYSELILTILDEALIRCGLAADLDAGRWASWRAALRSSPRIAGSGN
ncbi:MAG: ATP-grasp domain-containing protein [Bacillota bacterium]|nr:MAG: ATP-grasp domain-containing protein [Bacillota bacterium]